jgi:hypothetical protein
MVVIVGGNARVAKAIGEIEWKSELGSSGRWQTAEAVAVIVVAVMVMMVEVIVVAVVVALVQHSAMETKEMGWQLEGKGEDPMGVVRGSPSTELQINN